MKNITKNLLIVFFLIFGISCSSSDTGNTNNASKDSGTSQKGDAAFDPNISLSGVLLGVAKTDTANGTPLANHKLFCVTLSDPPAAGTGTSDVEGKVTVNIKAANVPFGCFVRDANNNVVATLVFIKSDTEAGETLQVARSTYLGPILVDVSSGVATVSVAGANTELVNKAQTGAACPIGVWIGELYPTSCVTNLKMTERVTIKKDPESNNLLITAVYGPMYLGPNNTNCGYSSTTNLQASFANNQLTLAESLAIDPTSCPAKKATYKGTVDLACKIMTIDTTIAGCAQCLTSGGQACDGCGAVTCNEPAISYYLQ